jgi:hypothetical protein
MVLIVDHVDESGTKIGEKRMKNKKMLIPLIEIK